MTKLVVEIKNEKQIAVVKALLRLLNISVVEEKKVNDASADSLQSFYGQFQIDLSNFKFDRDLANER